MKSFDEFLISRLYSFSICGFVKTESVKSFPSSQAIALPRRLGGWAFMEAIRMEHVEGIDPGFGVPICSSLIAPLYSHSPCRSVPGRRIALVTGDLGVGHPIEIIVGLIVRADVFEAKTEILALSRSAHRSAVLAESGATRMGASYLFDGGLRGCRPDANAIENRRVQIHV